MQLLVPASKATDQSPTSSMLGFFKRDSLWVNFLKDFQVCSLSPTTHRAIKLITKKIQLNQVQKLIELGPGNGVITESLLSEMPTNSKIFAFERNIPLCSSLENTIKDPRLITFNSCASKVKQKLAAQIGEIDTIISCVPLSVCGDVIARQVIQTSFEMLKPQGLFIVYQCYLPPILPSKNLIDSLRNKFSIEGQERVLRNFPPLAVLTCRKVV